jgi:hypothetical protein
VEFLNDPQQRQAWFTKLETIDWNVFIQGPPHGKSHPTQVVKYLAGYLTGGPISDRRILSADNDEVWIHARPKRSSKKKRGMHAPRPYRLSARQFMQRWSLHVLPRGFIRSRAYGGYHGSQRVAYLDQCRQLNPEPQSDRAETEATDRDLPEVEPPKCPHCAGRLALISSLRRPSWRIIFERDIYHADVDSPMHYLGIARPPPQQPVG